MWVEVFDTTLRDGTQGEGVTLSVRDKLAIVKQLDHFGIDVIEGGWPGSNPKDEEFFREAKKLDLEHARLCAFGSTARSVENISSDPNLNAILNAETPVAAIFGKTWKLHSEIGLGISENVNAQLIEKSIEFLKINGMRVIFDAEHFFDGFKDDSEVALQMLDSAVKGGADTLVLCDTNGGSLTNEIAEIVALVKEKFEIKIGIHAHNDSDTAVANTLAAIQSGASHVQGTLNGVGERCGNANLGSIIPNLVLKLGFETSQKHRLAELTGLTNFVYEMMNIIPNSRNPFVGKSAFAHKGGIHVSAVLKNSRMYEHIRPELIGNMQRVLVSDLSGQSNIRYKAKELGVDLSNDQTLSKRVVNSIKKMEYEGYQFDGAEASFELILRSEMNEFKPFFRILDSKVNVFFDALRHSDSEAVLKVEVNGEIEHTASDGIGPVNALDNALRKALLRFYPEISMMKLVDYKVRVLDGKDATEAKVRVIIESSDGDNTWSTVGVSANIIEASLIALCDSINYKLFMLQSSKVEVVN